MQAENNKMEKLPKLIRQTSEHVMAQVKLSDYRRTKKHQCDNNDD